ncbi:hypothetical protein Lfu02_80160 [Longispora fulva]|uniref:Uncharacterized protein n=1 Tax=Longispora fulva TaxID=619741 RepID=A0A8J7GYN2_9ACTN|nr:hypothetical protein [Longispora fulva]MBG6140686.1 hypothetical protein [Longispora fulva]GIG63644.1 hypothetical protein Lfu02_80160 [Longispora fulva]
MNVDALAAEATRAPGDPLLVRTMHGRVWRFGQLDIRPAALRRYATLADRLAGRADHQIAATEAIEVSAVAEDMLRSALPTADREAFDTAPFSGTEIGAMIADYFGALGVGPGESVASRASSSSTRGRSRRTSRRSRR